MRWSRGADRTYTFTSTAAAAVVRVDYYVDGWRIGTVRRSASSDLRIRYRFSSETRNRRFEARGYNSAGAIVGRAYGLIEPVATTAVAIRQTGHATYEFGVERAPSGVRSIEVRVDDGFLLRDSVSGDTRSTRLPRTHDTCRGLAGAACSEGGRGHEAAQATRDDHARRGHRRTHSLRLGASASRVRALPGGLASRSRTAAVGRNAMLYVSTRSLCFPARGLGSNANGM